MTDPHDPLDDALRDALRAEAADAEPGPDLLARVREASRPTRRPPILLAVAAAVAIGVVAVGLAWERRSDDESIRLVDTPGVSTTSTTACVEDPVGNPPCGDAGAGAIVPAAPRPTILALVRDDGWLVTIDLDTGEQHELLDGGRPEDHDVETAMAYYIESVEVSPDGEWVYYQQCCEPAGGQTYRLPADGSGTEPEPVAAGYHPRVGPDGEVVATWGGGVGLFLTGTDGTVIDTPDQDDAVNGGVRTPDWMYESTTDLSWSPDGSMVSLATEDPEDDLPRRVYFFAVDGDGITPLAYGNEEQPDTRRFPLWSVFEEDGVRTGFGPVFRDDLGAVRHLSQDHSYGWLLWVEEDGTVSWTTTLGAEHTQLPDLPKARLADW